MTSSHSALGEFLSTARWPNLPDIPQTFFSIAGIERREISLSNVYAFFFRSKEKHQLNALFTEALFDVLERLNPAVCRVTSGSPMWVAREYPVRANGEMQRLDLLLHDGASERNAASASVAVLIENKVDHSLNNDLKNYWESIDASVQKFGVVLGVHPELLTEHPDWVFVSHLDLARAVERRLGPALAQVPAHYLPVLLHFLEHIKQMSNSIPAAFSDAFAFSQQHRLALRKAQEVVEYLGRPAPTWIADVVQLAFGEEYARGHHRDDMPRVHIMHKSRGGIEYLVWFGHILDLKETPSFSITLFSALTEPGMAEALRTALAEASRNNQTGIGRPGWFADLDWSDEMLVGKDYVFTGNTLTELEAAVNLAFRSDWKPIEPIWLGALTALEAPATSE